MAKAKKPSARQTAANSAGKQAAKNQRKFGKTKAPGKKALKSVGMAIAASQKKAKSLKAKAAKGGGGGGKGGGGGG